MRQLVAVAGVYLMTLSAAAAPTAPVYPGPNQADEPLRKEFSLTAAGDFLDAATADWWNSRQCFTCHTNYSYLIARPGLKEQSVVATNTRRVLEELVEKRWAEKG